LFYLLSHTLFMAGMRVQGVPVAFSSRIPMRPAGHGAREFCLNIHQDCVAPTSTGRSRTAFKMPDSELSIGLVRISTMAQ